jgi:type III secretion protein C
MKHLVMWRWLQAVLLAMALMCASGAQAAPPPHWKDTGFSINADGMTLRQVLEEFGRVYGARVSFSTKGETYLRGRLKADSGTEFLDRLTQPYKFRWFVYNDTLYIVPRDENASMRIEVGEDGVQDAKAALIGLGLFDTRFGWGELPDEGTVIVSGPRAYVDLVRDVLLPEEGKEAKKKGKQIMVFRLKYASATDRVINSRGNSETIPGVKTILNNLLFGPTSGEKISGLDVDMASGKRSREGPRGKGSVREVANGTSASNTNANARTAREAKDEEEDHPRKPKPREEKPRIEADPSLNAVMVYDNVNKREMYRELIEQLDIEPQQIEIEALIVDIDRSKLSDLGVEWGVRKGNTVSRINGTAGDSAGVDLPLPGATLLISNAAQFYLRLKALEGSGQAHVLAKPTVLTLDNVAAVLDLNQTTYVPLVGERVADLANVTAGTMLRVVPRIVQEGEQTRVRLEVDIEDGTIGDSALKSNVTRSTISTQAIIDLQQTLMIGGYRAESVSRNEQKVPVLGDVPLFGGLFRNQTESRSTRERLFLITPRITGSTGVTARARSELARTGRKVALADYRSFATPKPAPGDTVQVQAKAPVTQAPAPQPIATPIPAPAPTTAPAPAAAPAPATVMAEVPMPTIAKPAALKFDSRLGTEGMTPAKEAAAEAPASTPAAVQRPPKRQCARPKLTMPVNPSLQF